MESKTQINENGRIVIPARLRKALGLRPGDGIVLKLEDGTIRMIPLKEAIHLAQLKVQQYVSEGEISMNEELK
jgi:AbrB family looped-hinge helix DNA binding protein